MSFSGLLNIKISKYFKKFMIIASVLVLILTLLYLTLSSRLVEFSYKRVLWFYWAYFRVLFLTFSFQLISWTSKMHNNKNNSVKIDVIKRNVMFIACVLILFAFSYKENSAPSSGFSLFSLVCFSIGLTICLLSLEILNSIKFIESNIWKNLFLKDIKRYMTKYFWIALNEIYNFWMKVRLSFRKTFNFVRINYKKTALINLFHKIKGDIIDSVLITKNTYIYSDQQ